MAWSGATQPWNGESRRAHLSDQTRLNARGIYRCSDKLLLSVYMPIGAALAAASLSAPGERLRIRARDGAKCACCWKLQRPLGMSACPVLEDTLARRMHIVCSVLATLLLGCGECGTR